MTTAEPFNVLIVKLSSLGDVVQTIPVVHDILTHYPNAKIDWVVEEAFAPLLNYVQGIERVIPISQRRWNKLGVKQWFNRQCRTEKSAFMERLRTREYDVVLDLQGLIKSGLVTRRAVLKKTLSTSFQGQQQTPFRATYANRSDSCGYEFPVRWCTQVHIDMPARIHAIQRTRLLCARALGYSENILNHVPKYTWRTLVDETNKQNRAIKNKSNALPTIPYVLLVHGSSRVDNAWPIQAWQELALKLNKQGFQVLIPHSNDFELSKAKQIASANVLQTTILERCDLLHIAKLIAHSSGVIGLDTGLSHMAIGLNKRCIHIFLHDRAWRAGPLVGALSKHHQRSIGGLIAPSGQAVWSEWQLSA